jgi:hypothetical protein
MADGILNAIGTLRVVGFRSAFWYAVYRFQLQSGISRRRTPLRSWEDILRRLPEKALVWNPDRQPAFFFDNPQAMGETIRRLNPQTESAHRSDLENIQSGKYLLWEDGYHELGFPPEWNRNPLTGRSDFARRHWTEVNEGATGDVKGLWELSRFSLAFRLARLYAMTGDKRAPEAFWQLLESWLSANPPNSGPQWLSSQEVALRALAWIFSLRAFARSPATNAARAAKAIAALDAHARRIEATLAYARAQNNNHLISEAAGLFTIGLLFPDLPNAGRWQKLGHSLLESTSEQFFSDGGYIQHSINYHRQALQLYLWALRLGEIHSQPFSKRMYDSVDRSLELLSALVDPETGRMPNFGHNDGALFLALNSCDYEDYRPLLQSLALWRKGARIWDAGPWDEDALWLIGPDVFKPAVHEFAGQIAQTKQNISAPRAGLFLLPGRESRAIVRCAQFCERPAHADQLHVDLWWRGENIACDPGSYLYGDDPPWRNSMAHAAVHNTVTIDGLDQMQRSGRFGWATLAQAQGELFGNAKWQGSHDGYRTLGITHRRTVEHMDEDIWVVTDDLIGRGTHTVRLHWLIPDYPWEWNDLGKDPAQEELISEKMMGWKDGSGVGLILRTPAGGISLRVWSSRPALWNLCRAGEKIHGEDAQDRTIPDAISGWRSLRYASKIPALALAGWTQGISPVRFISVWIPRPPGNSQIQKVKI